jgi:hypothetical protein
MSEARRWNAVFESKAAELEAEWELTFARTSSDREEKPPLRVLKLEALNNIKVTICRTVTCLLGIESGRMSASYR